VVKSYRDAALFIDISQFIGGDICQCLQQRDFTINSMGLSLNAMMAEGEAELIDCFAGLKDLKKALIKHIEPNSVKADPLRMLRAFRLSCSLGFKIDEELQRLIENNVELIQQSAGERISIELYHIFAQPESFPCISQMDKSGLLQQIFPEISLFKEFKLKRREELDLWWHSLQTLKMLEKVVSQLDDILPAFKKNIEEHITKRLAWGRARLPLLKLAALLHDLGKPETFKQELKGKISFVGHEKIGSERAKKIAQRLRLSRREGDYLSRLIYYHLRPYYLFNSIKISRKAIYRFFRHLGEQSLDCLLLFMADALSYISETDLEQIGRIKGFISKIIKSYFSEFLYQEKEPRLVKGDELMEAFKLKPGKLIGHLLEKVSEAQALGKVKSKEEALGMVETLLQKKH